MPSWPAVAAPLIYLFFDLGPWLAALAAAFVAARAARGRPAVARIAGWWKNPRGSAATELAVAALAVAAVVVSTERIRFHPALHGDEPKYLRFDEAFYQGLGFDLTDYRIAATTPIGDPPRLMNSLRLLAAAIPRELRQLDRDARRFARRGWSEPFNRAKSMENWFIQGKRGGVYQVHTPGLSFALAARIHHRSVVLPDTSRMGRSISRRSRHV